jgi:hypothetical protein
MTILLLVIGFLFLFAAIDVAKNISVDELHILFDRFVMWLWIMLGGFFIYLAAHISQSH